jgi:hypothetical protein
MGGAARCIEELLGWDPPQFGAKSVVGNAGLNLGKRSVALAIVQVQYIPGDSMQMS